MNCTAVADYLLKTGWNRMVVSLTHPDVASLVGPLFAARKRGQEVHFFTILNPSFRAAKRGCPSEAVGG